MTAVPESSRFNDVTENLIGSAVPSLLLYAAKQRHPTASSSPFDTIALDQCRFGLSRQRGSDRVVLSVKAVEGEDTLQKPFVHREILDLSSESPLLLGDQFLSLRQISLLRSLAKISNPDLSPPSLLECTTIPIEYLPEDELPELFARKGKFHVFGQVKCSDGSTVAIDCFVYNAEFQICIHACAIPFPGQSCVPRTPAQTDGYLVEVAGLEEPALVSGLTQRQAEYLFQCLIDHTDDFGIAFTAGYVPELIQHALHHPSGVIGTPVTFQECKSAPLSFSLADIQNALQSPGRHEFNGYLPIGDDPDIFCYADIACWRGRSNIRSVRDHSLLASEDVVVLRAVSNLRNGTYEPPRSEAATTGYVLEVGPYQDVFELDDVSREFALELFELAVSNYKTGGLSRALEAVNKINESAAGDEDADD